MTDYKFNLTKYVYGQIYKAYLQSGEQKTFKVHHIKAQTWYYVLKKLVERNKIKNFELGKTDDTALDIIIEGFDKSDMWYKPYTAAIKKNLKEEAAA